MDTQTLSINDFTQYADTAFNANVTAALIKLLGGEVTFAGMYQDVVNYGSTEDFTEAVTSSGVMALYDAHSEELLVLMKEISTQSDSGAALDFIYNHLAYDYDYNMDDIADGLYEVASDDPSDNRTRVGRFIVAQVAEYLCFSWANFFKSKDTNNQ